MKKFSPVSSYAVSRRGSILLMVVSLLAVLALFATTLLYTSRLEVQASSNAARSVQDRMAAVTGISDMVLYLEPMAGLEATESSLLQPATIDKNMDGLAFRDAADQSGLLNINTLEIEPPLAEAMPPGTGPRMLPSTAAPASTPVPVSQHLPATAFGQFLRNRMVEAGAGTAQADTLLRHILDKNQAHARGLADAATDDAHTTSSINENAPFQNVRELLSLPGMTPEVWQAIAPYLTAHSASLDVWVDFEGNAFARAPINELDPLQIFAVLSKRYPDKDPNLLRQVAVNIVDRRDEDNIPTIFPDVTGSLPIIGFERNLVISEVCPDVMTLDTDGDNGEYIEIFNPLQTAVDVDGWMVSWSAGGAVLGRALLNGRIEASAHLIITDNIKGDYDRTPRKNTPGMGNFYEVFKILPLGNDRIIESLGMDIPNAQGAIALSDSAGNLIDYITYSGATFNGLNRGFAKANLFVHSTVPQNASPFRNTLSPPAADSHEVACWMWMIERMNTPFQSPAELLAVAQFFTPSGSLVSSDIPLFIPLQPGEDNAGLDTRLLDLFTVSERPLEMVLNDEGELVPVFVATSRSAGDLPARAVPAPLVYGRLNLNTAPVGILEVLPGFNAERAGLLERLRTHREQPLVLRNLSDLVSNDQLWVGATAMDRFRSIMHVAPLVTFQSSTWSVESTASGRTANAIISYRPSGGLDIQEWRYR